MAMMLTIGDSNISNFTRESCEFSTGALGISQDKSQISCNLWRSPWRTMQKRLADVPLGNAVVMSVEISWNIAIDIHRPWTKSCLIWLDHITAGRKKHQKSVSNLHGPPRFGARGLGCLWSFSLCRIRSGHVGRKDGKVTKVEVSFKDCHGWPWILLNSHHFTY